MESKEILTLKDVTKTYGEMRALSPLSLRIRQGESVALIGPSGAGKTTLLNILANVIQADAGEYEISGKPAHRYTSGKQLARKVGMIRQQFDLIRPLPVIHNVLAGRLGEWGFFKSMVSFIFPQEKEVAARALERVGLADKIYEKTANLSGGEQQRVALARLLVQHPEVILADEPVSSLDPARAEDVLSKLVNLANEENQTLVASLHSVELAKQYFTRLIALREGKVYFDLAVEDVTDEALSKLYDLVELKDDEKVTVFS
ncbi:MAG TPA: ATP-binding cassette domain-containing protein [Bacillales bacterium]|nr:ATP-binding cassette domain-containing protein [Bacillales bacterium]HEU5141391.1 ATP-binding cassette domain-containing protein [Bacillales bacterium]